jgi:AAA ATPase domain
MRSGLVSGHARLVSTEEGSQGGKSMSPVSETDATDMTATLVSRERECAPLKPAWTLSRSGGVAVLVRGEAGVGKSVLVTSARDRAKSAGMAVLEVSGVRPEAPVPFAVLHQLLRPLLNRAQGLAQPQRDALLATFGMEAEWPASCEQCHCRQVAANGMIELFRDWK